MGILTRLTRMWKADMHGVMDQFEDDILLLKQCLRDMEKEIDQVETEQEGLDKKNHGFEKTAKEIDTLITGLDTDINNALRHEKDDIARHYIKRLKHAQQQRSTLQHKIGEVLELRTLVGQRLTGMKDRYEKIRLEASIRLQKDNNDWPDFTQKSSCKSNYWPTGEEVELELLMRKKALAKEDHHEDSQ